MQNNQPRDRKKSGVKFPGCVRRLLFTNINEIRSRDILKRGWRNSGTHPDIVEPFSKTDENNSEQDH